MRNIKNIKTDALARVLALRPTNIRYKPDAELLPEEIERETSRLNALPKDSQMQIFCEAMGFAVIEYLNEKSKFNQEIINEIEWLDL